MAAAYQSVPLDETLLPRMNPQAVLNMDVSELSERLGLEFVSGCDDLDYYKAAAVEAAGETAVLIAHRGNPQGVAQVYLVDAPGFIEGVPGTRERARERLDAVILALGLDAGEVAWRQGDLTRA
jgi:hypothetical protein